eukprot:518688-Prymnesium_polylepis.1
MVVVEALWLLTDAKEFVEAVTGAETSLVRLLSTRSESVYLEVFHEVLCRTVTAERVDYMSSLLRAG